MFKCNDCDFETENGKIMSNHKRWNHSKKFNREAYSQIMSKIKSKGELKEIERACPECGKIYKTFIRLNKLERIPYRRSSFYKKNFCSTSCSHAQGSKYWNKNFWTKEKRKEASERSKELWKNEDYAKRVLTNSRSVFSSKREREIIAYFQEKFPEDGWTFGRIGKYEDTQLTCDLYSPSLKVIFEYDGIWHFKDIHNQLERKQKVDRNLEKFAFKKGYRLVRVDEDEKLSNLDIEKLIYNRTEQIIKVGNKY
jgi:hypothetical protein